MANKTIKEDLEEFWKQESKWRNSMWVSESFYNPYFLLSKCIEENNRSVDLFTEKELQYMLEVAMFATEAFY